MLYVLPKQLIPLCVIQLPWALRYFLSRFPTEPVFWTLRGNRYIEQPARLVSLALWLPVRSVHKERFMVLHVRQIRHRRPPCRRAPIVSWALQLQGFSYVVDHEILVHGLVVVVVVAVVAVIDRPFHLAASPRRAHLAEEMIPGPSIIERSEELRGPLVRARLLRVHDSERSSAGDDNVGDVGRDVE
ncbi:hypothetical protein GE09DRAFT_134137 [Coniochaeta sp. 2T2.1]|nr:hypothetical protein GE09DRAFT_134137 [Coniochaeta sp. 2T2.1]